MVICIGREFGSGGHEIGARLAKEGNCILVGRCADYVLQKAGIRRLSVFITAPFEIRVRRKMEILKRDEQETAAIVRRTDRVRKAYYNYRTNGEWGCPSNYDVCINSASLGIAQTVQAMKNFCIHADLQET